MTNVTIEKAFIIPVVMLASIKLLAATVDSTNKKGCFTCYRGAELELAAIVLCVVYLGLSMTGNRHAKSAKYVALLCAIFLVPGILRYFMRRYVCDHNQIMDKEEEKKVLPPTEKASPPIEPAKPIPHVVKDATAFEVANVEAF